MRALGQRGGSLTEFAIVAPVLISMVMFATYFADAWDFKLKNQEAARFAAWEFTAFPLSDYVNADHATLYNTAREQIRSDVQTLYADFDSAQGHAPTRSFVGVHELEMPKIQFEDLDVPLESRKSLSDLHGFGDVVAPILGAVNGGLELVGPEPYKFDMKGMVKVTVTSKFTNALLPDNFLGKFRYGQINQWETSDTVAVVADAWTLHDGRDVLMDPGGSGMSLIDGRGRSEHPMATEVDRMSFLGLRDKLIPDGVQSAVHDLEHLFGATFPDPLFLFAGGSPVVSLNYRRAAGSDGYSCPDSASPAKHGEVDFKNSGRQVDLGQNCFHTIPFRVTMSYDSSPVVQIFNATANHYMGCKSEQAEDTVKAPCR